MDEFSVCAAACDSAWCACRALAAMIARRLRASSLESSPRSYPKAVSLSWAAALRRAVSALGERLHLRLRALNGQLHLAR